MALHRNISHSNYRCHPQRHRQKEACRYGLFSYESKAFDSIDHALLISKLEDVGVSKSTLEWFRSYLSNRKQVAKIHSTKSEPLPVVIRKTLRFFSFT